MENDMQQKSLAGHKLEFYGQNLNPKTDSLVCLICAKKLQGVMYGAISCLGGVIS